MFRDRDEIKALEKARFGTGIGERPAPPSLSLTHMIVFRNLLNALVEALFLPRPLEDRGEGGARVPNCI